MSVPEFAADGVTIHQGDALSVLAELPAGSVQTCVTSPPYWGLRDYGVAGQLGLERNPDCLGWATGSSCGECYVCRIVTVFRAVRRVLREDGTLWLNLGDIYAGYWGQKYAHKPFGTDRTPDAGTPPNKPSLNFKQSLIKPKDLIGIPWRVALALQADGWYLRGDVIWSKPNPMPESVSDRPTRAHEYLFLLSKSPRYYYDAEAVKETVAASFGQQATGQHGTADLGPRDGGRHRLAGRNKRSVWTIPTRPFAGAHFAVFPAELITPCLLAGTSAGGCCPECGAPYRRIVERRRVATRPGRRTKTRGLDGAVIGNRDPQRHVTMTQTVGWEPGCQCDAGEPVACTVLDPFLGSGTTAAVAQRWGRRCVGIELNPEYCRLAAGRFRQRNLLPVAASA